MDNRPIGVFDSGLGGLTALRELAHLMPEEHIVYFGDTGRVPYGTRSRETILKYTRQDMAFLLSQNVKLVIAACGTVSSVAGTALSGLCVPSTGVLRPTALAAAAATKNRKIGVIGTTATIRSGAYRRALLDLDRTLSVWEQDCPLFVPLVENGFGPFVRDDETVIRTVADHYLSPLRERGVDTLILGCTHYPLLAPVLQDLMGPSVFLVDSGRETAQYCADLLRKDGLTRTGQGPGTCSFYVSDRADGFSRLAEIFLGRSVERDVQYVDIDAY